MMTFIHCTGVAKGQRRLTEFSTFLILLFTIVIVFPAHAQPSLTAKAVKGESSIAQQVDLHHLIEAAASKYLVPSELIAGIIKLESNANPCAVSIAKAQGIMQIIPATASYLKLADPFEPQQAVFAGVRYIRELLEQTNGNIIKMAAFYNYGSRAFDKPLSQLPQETQHYVAKLVKFLLANNKGNWKAALPQRISLSDSKSCNQV